MDVREKLVELIEEAIDYERLCREIKHFTGSEEYDPFATVADYLLDNGVTVQKWIPVTERLPEVGSRVIACGEKGGVFIVKPEGITTGFGRMDGTSKYRSFTHWIPMPQPPKGVKDNE